MSNIIWGTLSAGGVRVNDYYIAVTETESGHRITISRTGYEDQVIDIPDEDMSTATEAANTAASAANSAASSATEASAFNDNGFVEASTNPAVLMGTAGGKRLTALTFDGIEQGTWVNVSGKNILFFASVQRNLVNNGIAFATSNGVMTITSADPAPRTTLSANSNFGTIFSTVNGVSWWHNYKFRFASDTVVTVSGNASEHLTYDSKVQMMIGDGATNLYVDDNGLTFVAKAGVEYAARWAVLAGWSGTISFKPQIEIGSAATAWEPYKGERYAYVGSTLPYSQPGQTVVFSYDDSEIVQVKAVKATTQERAEESAQSIATLSDITGSRAINGKKALISFIDDDTNNVALVTRFHNCFSSYGVPGNYAVMTIHLNESEAGTTQSGLVDLLRSYEEEGFGCIYHCYYQAGDETRYWERGNAAYDESLIKANFIRGLREIRDYGFSAYDYWVTPYGVNDDFIQSLARTHNMRCLLSMGSSSGLTQNSYVRADGNVSRWDIPRISVFRDANITRIKAIIDALSQTGGWLNVVTHANTWGATDQTVDDMVKGLIEYCLSKNCEIVSVPDAFAQMETSFILNDLLNERG